MATFALLTTVWPEPRPARSTSVNLARGEPSSFASLSYLVDPQALHNRHIGRPGFLVSKNTHPAPPFGVGDTRAALSHRIAKDAPDDPDILSLRHDCPTLAGVSGKWSLLDGMSTIATGSFLAEPARSRHLFTAFPPGIPCAALLLDPLLPGPLQRAALCTRDRSSCWPGGGWITGCSRQDS